VGFQLCVISGMMVCRFCLDTVGFLSLPKRKPNFRRALSVLFLIAASILATLSLETADAIAELAVMWCCAHALGALLPVQGCCNGTLVKHTRSTYKAVAVSFILAIPLVSVATIVWGIASRETFNIEVAGTDVWMFLSGVCGTALLTCNAKGMPVLGPAVFTSFFLATQLISAFVCDSIGAFNFEPQEISAQKLFGIALAILSITFNQFNIKLCQNNKQHAPATEPPRSGVAGAARAARASIRMVADDVDEDEKSGSTSEAPEHSQTNRRMSVRNGM